MTTKTFFITAVILSAFFCRASAQNGNYVCILKKDCHATDVIRENINIPLKAGEQYQLNGTSGQMLVITVKGKHYYIAKGCVTTHQVNARAAGAAFDTIGIVPDSLPVFERER